MSLTREIYSEIAKRIDDPDTWYNYCLTNKMVWNTCKYKIRALQKQLCKENIYEDGWWHDTCWVTEHVLPNGNRNGPYKVENRDYRDADEDFDVELLPRVIIETGWYDNGKKDGVWKQYTLDGSVKEECQWSKDEKHGQETKYYCFPNGTRQIKHQLHWCEGKQVGAETHYEKDGTVKSYKLHNAL